MSKVAGVCSFYFIGFAGGIVLLPLPNAIGRKGSMNILMPIYIIASGMVVFCDSLSIKSLGMFI